MQDGDWARVSSAHGDDHGAGGAHGALNDNTVWTWNAIGKRKGAWALDPGAPEATRGFLLNHLIHELLPPKGDGHRWANSDPITGQAAWFDLRVRIEKVATPPREAHPAFPTLASPVGRGPKSPRLEDRPMTAPSLLCFPNILGGVQGRQPLCRGPGGRAPAGRRCR